MLATVVASTATLSSNSYKSACFFTHFTSILWKQFAANDTFLREANSYKRTLALRNSWQVNVGEPPPETYNSYSAHSITLTIVVAPIPSDHFPPFMMICIITVIIHILVHTFLSDSLNLQNNTFFSPNHHNPFLNKTCPHHCNSSRVLHFSFFCSV